MRQSWRHDDRNKCSTSTSWRGGSTNLVTRGHACCVLTVVMAAGMSVRMASGTDRPLKQSEHNAVARVGIFHAPTLPIVGVATAPAILERIMRDAGLDVARISTLRLNTLVSKDGKPRVRLLVVPSGQSFPAAGREPLIQFLRDGGDLITIGGYAFNHLLRRVNGKWVSEQQYAQAQLDRATRPEKSLLQNGGYEKLESLPLIDGTPSRNWQRSSAACTITDDSPGDGRRCARVTVQRSREPSSETFYTYVPLTNGRRYQVSGMLRTRDFRGPGIAYIAAYQLDQQGQPVAWRDFAVLRMDSEWQSFAYRFSAAKKATQLRVQCGLFQAHGTVWIDNVGLFDITGLEYKWTCCRGKSHSMICVPAVFSLAEHFTADVRPIVHVKPMRAEVVARCADGRVVMTHNHVGDGQVDYVVDPLEQGADRDARKLRRRILHYVLDRYEIKRPELTPDVDWLRVLVQPTRQGDAHVIVNIRQGTQLQRTELRTAAGVVTMDVRDQWPALAVATTDGRLVLGGADGMLQVDGVPIMTGRGQRLIVSLDGQDLRRAAAVLVAPLQTGTCRLGSCHAHATAVVGEFRAGKWVTLETLGPVGTSQTIPIDADRATGLILICPAEEQVKWQSRLSNVLCRPGDLPGY